MCLKLYIDIMSYPNFGSNSINSYWYPNCLSFSSMIFSAIDLWDFPWSPIEFHWISTSSQHFPLQFPDNPHFPSIFSPFSQQFLTIFPAVSQRFLIGGRPWLSRARPLGSSLRRVWAPRRRAWPGSRPNDKMMVDSRWDYIWLVIWVDMVDHVVDYVADHVVDWLIYAELCWFLVELWLNYVDLLLIYDELWWFMIDVDVHSHEWKDHWAWKPVEISRGLYGAFHGI